jgi:hypothetical protein
VEATHSNYENNKKHSKQHISGIYNIYYDMLCAYSGSRGCVAKPIPKEEQMKNYKETTTTFTYRT